MERFLSLYLLSESHLGLALLGLFIYIDKVKIRDRIHRIVNNLPDQSHAKAQRAQGENLKWICEKDNDLFWLSS